MATNWYIAGVDTIFDTIGNHSASEGGASNGTYPQVGDDLYLSDTSSPSDISLDSDEACDNVFMAAADTSGTDDWTGIFDLLTHALTLSGEIKTASGATLKLGTSAGNGLTANGINLAQGSVADYQEDSVINNNGNYYCHDSSIFANTYRGDYTQSGDGTYENENAGNTFYNFTVDAGVTMTLADVLISLLVGNTSGVFGNDITINGTIIVVNNNILYFGFNNSFTIGVNGDIQGSGSLRFIVDTSATITWSKITALSFDGEVQFRTNSNSTRQIICADFSNAIVSYEGVHGSNPATLMPNAGTLKCKVWQITCSQIYDFTIDHATNNPNIEVTDDINFKDDVALYTLIYNKGTGTISLLTGDATTKSLDFQGKTIEDLIINSTDDSDIKQLINSVITDSLTITDGIFDIDTQDCTSNGLTDISGTLKIGVTASNGLITAGITFQSGSKRDWQINSKIYCSGDWIEQNEDHSTNNSRGTVTITNSINMRKPDYRNRFYSFTLEAGNTITATNNIQLNANSGSNQTIINGVMAMGNRTLVLGAGSTGLFSVGVNGDITGTQTIVILIIYGATLTNNRASAFSFSGLIRTTTSGSTDNEVIPAWDFSNANIRINGLSTNINKYISNGTLKCVDFEIVSVDGYTITIKNDVTNPDLEISGDTDLNTSTGTVIISKGNGNTWTFTGVGKTIALDNQSLPNVTSQLGSSQTFTEGFQSDNFTGNGNSTFTVGETYIFDQVNGSGTLQAASPMVIYVRGAVNFTGTLINIAFEEYPKGKTPKAYYGNRINKAIDSKI